MNDNQSEESELFEPVALDDYLEMTARMLGRVHALEAAMIAMLGGRDDIEDIARRADAFILNDEYSRGREFGASEESMRAHHYAQQAAAALFENARRDRRRRG